MITEKFSFFIGFKKTSTSRISESEAYRPNWTEFHALLGKFSFEKRFVVKIKNCNFACKFFNVKNSLSQVKSCLDQHFFSLFAEVKFFCFKKFASDVHLEGVLVNNENVYLISFQLYTFFLHNTKVLLLKQGSFSHE